MRVDNSTFVGNSAVGYGGAVTLFNSLSSASPSTIINSTLSGNHATSGGAVNNHVGDLYIKNSTLVGNTAEFGAALIARSSYPYGPTPYPRTFLAHTIITHLNGSGAGALCEDEHFRYTGGAVSGISSNQFNLRGDDSCRLFAAGDILFADPQLGPLAQNGGPTLTHAPLLSSPAVNRGSLLTSQNDQAPDCAPIDQRGVVRPQITATGQTPQCDIGAIELQGP